MKKYSWLFIACLVVMAACSSGSENESGEIDYATLDSLQTEVVLEIGESEDYLPGQLRDLVVAANGNLMVSDWSSVSIEQFDASGNYIASLAQEGGGPGELSNYFYMNMLGPDTLMVRQQSGQKNFYGPAEDGSYQFLFATTLEKLPERPVSILGPATDTTYYATTNSVITNMQEAMKNERDYTTRALVTASVDGEIKQDSLYQLKRAIPHITQVGGGGFSINNVPYRFEDRIILLDDGGYLIARPDSNRINMYNRDDQLQQRIPLDIKSRPITSDDLEYQFGEMESKLRNEIEARMHDAKPPYLNIWGTENYIWLHTDTSPKGKEIVVIDYEGQPLGKFMLPEVDQIQQIINNDIYTIHQSPEQGHMIRKYRVNL